MFAGIENEAVQRTHEEDSADSANLGTLGLLSASSTSWLSAASVLLSFVMEQDVSFTTPRYLTLVARGRFVQYFGRIRFPFSLSVAE